MPSLISNALGTQRQFTAQPDSVYQGRYRDVSPQHSSPSDTSNADSLASNMERLSQALQGYAVQHEKYPDSKGLREAQAMINQESAGAIEKLNAVDAAQIEGFADSLDNPYFKAYAEGFLGEAGSAFNQAEKDNLAFSALLMTLECGMRFLTDYINGDTYFKTEYPEHNLVRARNQFKMVEEIEKVLPEMERITLDTYKLVTGKAL